jgi:hypothetical protein
VAVAGLTVAIPVTVVMRSNAEEEPLPEPIDVEAQLPLNPRVVQEEIDAEYQVPQGWQQGAADDVLKLSSGNDSVQVGIRDAGPAGDTGELLDVALADLKLTYDRVEVAHGSGKKVGGLAAKGAVVSARKPKGDDELRILVAAAEGRRRAYLVEVFTAAEAPPRAVAEAQRLLNSLRLTG